MHPQERNPRRDFPHPGERARGHRFRSRGISAICEALEENAAAGAPLTRREHEIVHLTGEGLSTKSIADRLGLSPRTIESHRTRIFRKLGLCSAAELVRYAIANELADV